MIGTAAANVLVAFTILFATVLGMGAGGLACLALRQRWRFEGFIDAVLAAVVAVAVVYGGAAIESALGVWRSDLSLVLAIPAASVVVRHLVRRVRCSTN